MADRIGQVEYIITLRVHCSDLKGNNHCSRTSCKRTGKADLGNLLCRIIIHGGVLLWNPLKILEIVEDKLYTTAADPVQRPSL